MSVKLNISGLLIDFDTRYPEYIRRRCAAYLASEDAVCDLSLAASEEDIIRADRDNVGPMEAELFAMTIPLSERLPFLGRLMTHGVAVSYEGRSFIFTAESGVGKSTHAFLWQRYFGEEKVHVINGDKPILWLRDGAFFACGSPWSGKEHLDENVALPLGGICLLHRLEGSEYTEPCVFRASAEETFDFMMRQTFIPRSAQGQLTTLGLLDELYRRVPVYRLYADISMRSAEVCSQCLLRGGAGGPGD